MPRRQVEEQIEQLTRIREGPLTPVATEALRKGIGDRVNVVAAKAAEVAAGLGAKCLIPNLLASFDRFFKHLPESDPQCWAKIAIAKALSDLDFDESEPFLRGCRHIQMEPVWGGKTDTAGKLRSVCTLALVQCTDLPRAAKLRRLVATLTDREEAVRIDAIRAIEQMEGEEAALLLRLKASLGDKRAAVVGQALESLLHLEGPAALPFAAGFLEEHSSENPREFSSAPEEYVEEAALAVGASRLPEAVELLKSTWKSKRTIIFFSAISASRTDSGFDFLLDLVANGSGRDAIAAVDALSLHGNSREVIARTEDAARLRGGEVLARFRARFSREEGGS